MIVYRCDVCRAEHPTPQGLARIMIRVDLPAALLLVPTGPAPAKIVVELDLCKESDSCKAVGIHQGIAEVARQCSAAAGIPDKVAA